MAGPGVTIPWHWLGRLAYQRGIERQEAIRDRLLAGDESQACLLLLEHEPVITLGRHATEMNLVADRAALAAQGIQVARTSRGGDVTYHGPGQLMIYPVVRLARGVVAFLEALAGALAELARELGVPDATWQRNPAGLWVGRAKLAACGVHVRRSVCTHGFAFNVATPAEPWQSIVPCGLRAYGVTSIAREREARGLGPPPSVAEVAALAAPLLCQALEAQSRKRR